MSETEITVNVKDVTGAMYLRQELGEGTIGDVPFRVDLLMPSGDIYVAVGEGESRRAYAVELGEVVEKVCKHALSDGGK